MAEPGPEQGHQFHFEVDIQGAHRSADGLYVDEEQPAGLPFRVTVRAWNLRDACLAAAALALGGWTQPDENGAGSFELLNAAAERAHEAMHDCELAPDGIERELWQKVVLAVLADPRLLPAWARGARVDADTWRRACSSLDGELQALRALLRQRTAERDARQGRLVAQEQVLEIVRAQTDGCVEKVDAALGHRYHTEGVHFSVSHVAEKAAAEIDQLQARIDAALALLDPKLIGLGDCFTREEDIAHFAAIRAALQSDAPTEPAPDLERDTDTPTEVGEPKRTPCPEGYHFVGQRLTHCAECGLPPWVHAGRADLPQGAGPFGSGWVLKPWKPGEADRFRARVLGEPDVTPPDPSGRIANDFEKSANA